MSFDKIISRLYDWRKERHLDLKGQMEGLLNNVHEEIGEYCSAANDFEKVDAICDICVFCFNAMGELANVKKPIECDSDDLTEVARKIILANMIFERTNELVNKDDVETWRDRHSVANVLLNQFFDLVWEAISICENAVERLGFDFLKSMDETLKEIESRTGHWDEDEKKFIKDNRGSYTADYSKCKKRSVK